MNPEEELRKIAEEIRRCKKCPLWKNRTNAVPGEGPATADVMFIGEAPGRQEDLEGRPFVGAAGKLLTQLIESIGLSREEVYITNVVKCRPPGNRDPAKEEIIACAPYLNRQIEIIKPKIIVLLGRHSTAYIFGQAGKRVKGIMSVRGKIYRLSLPFLPNVFVIPTLHPAAALYNPRLKMLLEKDFELIRGVVLRVRKNEKVQYGLDAFLKKY